MRESGRGEKDTERDTARERERGGRERDTMRGRETARGGGGQSDRQTDR